MAAAMTQATTAVRRELANSPILARSPVNWTSEIRDVRQPAGVESGGTKNENGGVDKKRKPERDCGIEHCVTHGFTPIADGGAKSPRLDDAGVKIKIVRHDGRAKDADGDVQH